MVHFYDSNNKKPTVKASAHIVILTGKCASSKISHSAEFVPDGRQGGELMAECPPLIAAGDDDG